MRLRKEFNFFTLMQIPEGLFKAYDVRGIYKEEGDLGPAEMNVPLVRAITKAFVTHFDIETMIIGHDMRVSSPILAKAAAEAANELGANVVEIGLVGTDVTYFASGKWDMPAIMFTASHNPGIWNGMKFTRKGAAPVGAESGLKEIEELTASENFRSAETPGITEQRDAMTGYKEHVLSFVNQESWKTLKVVADAGNGMGGTVLPPVWEEIPGDLVKMYFEPDGTFPNHEPNPIDASNVVNLQERVKEEKADVGLAFDGDADRVYFIDEKGGRVPASLSVAMVAKAMLEKHPGATIIYNAVTSKIVPETVEANGGTAVMERVGHSYIKATMKETGAVFAGEHSGHYFFIDNYRADSGLIAALIVLEMIATSDKTFSEILEEFKVYHAIEETNSKVDDKDAAIARVREAFPDAKQTEYDGVTFEYDDYWFNIRPSNTEPVLRLNLEAKTVELRDEKAEAILNIIRS